MKIISARLASYYTLCF